MLSELFSNENTRIYRDIIIDIKNITSLPSQLSQIIFLSSKKKLKRDQMDSNRDNRFFKSLLRLEVAQCGNRRLLLTCAGSRILIVDSNIDSSQR